MRQKTIISRKTGWANAVFAAFTGLLLLYGCQHPAAKLNTQGTMDQLQSDLGSTDRKTRERAEAELSQVPPTRRDELWKLGESAANAEVKARIRARVDALDELQLTDPPPIALDVANADAGQLAAALSQATGITFSRGDLQAATARFSLKAETRLWDLRQQLSTSSPLSFYGNENGFTISGDEFPKMQSSVVRGFQIRAGELIWGVVGSLPPASTRPGDLVLLPQVTGLMELGIDPRIKVAQVGQPHFTRYVDDQGFGWVDHSIGTEKAPRTNQILFYQAMVFQPMQRHGTKLSIAGKWPVDILLESQHAEVTNLSGALPEPIRIGDVEIKFQRLNLLPPVDGIHSIQLTITVRHLDSTLGQPMSVAIAVIGRDGKVLHSLDTTSQDGTTSAGIDQLPEMPAKIVFTVPTMTRRVWVPFQFNNLPIADQSSAPGRFPRW